MSFQPTALPKDDESLRVAALERIHDEIAQTFNDTAEVVSVPATSSSNGSTGQIAFNTSHLYVCVSKNTWRRVALSTF